MSDLAKQMLKTSDGPSDFGLVITMLWLVAIAVYCLYVYFKLAA